MSSSAAKSLYDNINTAKWKGTDAQGGGGSSSVSAAKSKNELAKGTSNRVKVERPRETPASKFHDLIMHGIKPNWNYGADDFYESLIEARREFDESMEKNPNLPPKELPLSRFQLDSNAGDFYEARGEIEAHCQDEDSEMNPWEDSGVEPFQGEDFGIDPYGDYDYDAYQDGDSDY